MDWDGILLWAGIALRFDERLNRAWLRCSGISG